MNPKSKLAWNCCQWLIVSCIFLSCREDDAHNTPSLLQLIPSSDSNIGFVNTLSDDADFNIIEYLYYYNGGGVAIGDINNDSLPDIYFSGNQVSDRLYLNKGNFVFEDITESAGVGGSGNWKTGVSMADVNSDGLLDIYVCGVGNYKKFNSKNQLYINNGDLTFTERSKEYGLSFEGFATQTAFFDYDLDGDLDVYLLNHSVHSQRSYGKVSLRYQTDSLAGDRLYRNMLHESGKPYYENVTEQSGIYSSQIGYGLGIGISDLNVDGYPDLYISNDFVENDYVYINNGNGTFSEQVESSMPHTSRFSMGNDLADINNDNRPDIITLDMLPRDESVIKTSAGEDSYEIYLFKLKYGYHKQVSRNTLQINQGPLDSGRVVFQDIAPAAGVAATDWSWSPLMVDFDGDGWKDIFISNGIVKRPNDLDYINYISSDSIQKLEDVLPWLAKMPEGKVSNFIFKNNGDLTFEDKTSEWGLSLPSFSNGAAYADLDNDGDPDLVVNRINEGPLVYRNSSAPRKFVKVLLRSESSGGNIFGIGSKITLKQGTVVQSQELFPVRGWYSSSDYPVLFGIPDPGQPVTIEVIWPDGRTEVKTSNDHVVHFDHATAQSVHDYSKTEKVVPVLRQSAAPVFVHHEDEFNAFNRESLMPHMLTTEGPAMATADVNGDGLDDVFVGGARNQPGALFLQRKDGEFTKQSVPDFIKHLQYEDVSAAFMDADGDKDFDLVVVSGGQEEFKASELLKPRLYKNDGHGRFTFSPSSFGPVYLQASCVKPADFDNDGDTDLFIGSSVMPMLYGMSPVSYLLVNDGKGRFSYDHTWLGRSQFDNPTQVRPGMVKDAVWVDINKDQHLDLVLVGEWMPVTILLQQADHRFRNATNEYGLQNSRGWWNTIVAHDFDSDGDMDVVIGNLGLNSRITATTDKPLQMYLGDFDSNGASDHILVYYNGDKNYPFASRDMLVKQIPTLKKRFPTYRDYRDVKLGDIITPQQKGNSALMQVDGFSSAYLQNNGTSFNPIPLPFEAQLFPIYALQVDDVDDDGMDDILLTGNLTATQPEFGPYDAGLGLFLKGNGKGEFTALTPERSGFIVKGEGREITMVKNSKGEKVYLVARNNNSVLAFKKIKP